MAATIGGCAEDSPSVFLRAVVAPTPMGAFCAPPIDPNGAFRVTEGFLDLLASRTSSYRLYALIQNQLIARADLTAGRIESNFVQIDGFEVEIRDLAPDGPIINASAFGVPQSTLIPAAVGGSSSFATTNIEVIPSSIGILLRDGTTAVDPATGATVDIPAVCRYAYPRGVTTPDQQRVCPTRYVRDTARRLIIHFRAYGHTLGGVPIQTPYYDHPVTVCCGCLLNFLPGSDVQEAAPMGGTAYPQPDCDNGMATMDQSTCTPGQDFNADCRICSGSNVDCQPIGYTPDPVAARAIFPNGCPTDPPTSF